MTGDSATSPTITSDDKIWAAIAHASVLLSFWGPLVPAILWFLQRRKSVHVRFHALQALSYQIMSSWVGLILFPMMFVVLFVVLIMLIASPQGGAGNEEARAVMLPLLVWLPILGAFGLYVLIGLSGAVISVVGLDFRYPLLGTALQRKLRYWPADGASISEPQEDQVVGAVSHATCIMPMFGLVVPLIVWITQKERGGFLSFQSLQALFYQGLGTVVYFAIMALYTIATLASFAVLPLGVLNAETPSAGVGALLFLTMIPIACLMVVFLIGGQLYQLFGFIASLKTLRGQDYNYPLLGRFLRKRTGTPPTEAPA